MACCLSRFATLLKSTSNELSMPSSVLTEKTPSLTQLWSLMIRRINFNHRQRFQLHR